MSQKNIPVLLCLSLLVLAAIHIPGTVLGWYYSVRWLDIPMHILGGWCVALGVHYFFSVRWGNVSQKLSWWEYGLFVVGIVAMVGIAWEWYELFADVILNGLYAYNAAPGPIHFDTMKDLFDDMVGAVVGALVVWRLGESERV